MTQSRPGQSARHRRAHSRPRRVDHARRAAFDVLRAVSERDAYANLLLPTLLADRGLTGRDAALATELTYGTLRRRGTYDAVLAACANRPLEQVDPPVLDALRLGAHQVLATRVRPHAAVSTAVDLAAGASGAGSARFANAVLRRVATKTLPNWLEQVAPDPQSDPIGHLSIVHSHPRWVVQAYSDALDGSMEEVGEALVADNTRPPVCLVARPGRGTVAELTAIGARPARWSPWAAVLDRGDPGALEPVRAGRAAVQDEGSQLTALALAAAPLDGPDRRWLDVCAGPGGKAALLAGLASTRGARLLAADLRAHRARLVADALGDTAWVVVADGTIPAWGNGTFDRVLVDAPCSGLGALRRRPEARWRRTPADVSRLGRLQRTLLGAAVDSARPGGVVAYVTCSPHQAETREVVDAVRAARGDVESVDARPLLPGVPALGAGPDVQLWPHRHGTDAMYLAVLRRVDRPGDG